tara:strand:- start:762 stop:1313 length:552 start_codon:yes stop_codon:yes gene_type:complete
MKFKFLIKSAPFISTILLILILSISNQKEDAKLRILIWNTPTLSLGTYLTISIGTGFIISYAVTTNLANIKQSDLKKNIKYKDDKNDEIPEFVDNNINSSYDNILIEREINDPSPTINARFRVIGKTEKNNNDFRTNFKMNNIKYDDSDEFGDDYYEQNKINESNYSEKNDSIDWNDESFLNW